MKRREYLATAVGVAGVVVAGCLGSDPETEGDDDNPINEEPEDLLPTSDLFGDSWEQNGIDTEENRASTGFVSFDDEEDVQVEVRLFDSVEEAQSEYQDQYDADSEDADEDSITVESVDIASEGHWVDLGTTVLYFRDANVVAQLVHSDFDGRGSSSAAQEYAADWHETWRN